MTVGKLARAAWPWAAAATVFFAAAVVVRHVPDWLADAFAIAFLASWVLDALGLLARLGVRLRVRGCGADECAGQHVSR